MERSKKVRLGMTSGFNHASFFGGCRRNLKKESPNEMLDLDDTGMKTQTHTHTHCKEIVHEVVQVDRLKIFP